MPRVTHVKAARKAYPEAGIEVGDSYYHWKFRFGPRMKSKTYPKRQQLTRSEYLCQVYDLQDRVQDLVDLGDVEALVDEMQSDVEQLRDELQDRLDSMPEQLQDTSDAGMILTERIEALEYCDLSEALDAADFQELHDRCVERWDDGKDVDEELQEEINECLSIIQNELSEKLAELEV